MAVSPVGAGAVVDDDEKPCACGRGSMGAVLVALVVLSLSSGGDCAETEFGGGLTSSTNAIHARTKQVAPIVSAATVRNGKGCLPVRDVKECVGTLSQRCGLNNSRKLQLGLFPGVSGKHHNQQTKWTTCRSSPSTSRLLLNMVSCVKHGRYRRIPSPEGRFP